MKYLLTIEARDDLIVICRLLNVFRRKGARLLTLGMTLTQEGYCLMALVEAPEPEADNFYHFLRRTEGVHHVTCYRQHDSQGASFIFVNGDSGPPDPAHLAGIFPGSKLIFSSQGKTLLELAPDWRIAPASSAAAQPGFLPFARVRSTRSEAVP